jgi:hypothetical protein
MRGPRLSNPGHGKNCARPKKARSRLKTPSSVGARVDFFDQRYGLFASLTGKTATVSAFCRF